MSIACTLLIIIITVPYHCSTCFVNQPVVQLIRLISRLFVLADIIGYIDIFSTKREHTVLAVPPLILML